MSAPNGAQGAQPSDLPSAGYFWLSILLLAPFLMGGVVSGDEAYLLSQAHGVDNTSLSFAQYARSPEGWYIPHHILWFALVYATSHITAFFGRRFAADPGDHLGPDRDSRPGGHGALLQLPGAPDENTAAEKRLDPSSRFSRAAMAFSLFAWRERRNPTWSWS